MRTEVNQVSGVVVKGHRVASGPSKVYPYGTLVRQKPFFKAGGLDLDHFFSGTINVSIAPLKFEIIKPAYTFRQIACTDLHPPEDFSFSPCSALFQGKEFEGYVYDPHPETKIRHFQDPSVIEIITERIPGIEYGSQLILVLEAASIRIMTE